MHQLMRITVATTTAAVAVLASFTALAALTTGIAALGWEFAPVLQGQWL